MELDKTTLLSVIVWVAGLMSEIIFHDALSGSIPGIVLGMVIAVIVIIATYFIIDGIITDINNNKEKEWNKKTGYYEKKFQALSNKLDEQIRLEKSVYDKLDDILVISRGHMERAAESMFASQDDNFSKAVESITLEEAVEAINAKTLDSAKIIAKYQMKNTKELKESISLILDGLKGETGSK
ncbi:MAG: hypothetical protein HFH68_05010 [Lachnospiraceae bacterium]|nr:hypothetical protein [Lachnospiraceae bacterium]